MRWITHNQYTVKIIHDAIHIPDQVYFIKLPMCALEIHCMMPKYINKPQVWIFVPFLAKAVCPDSIKPSLSAQPNRLGVSVSDLLICLHASLNTLSLSYGVYTQLL